MRVVFLCSLALAGCAPGATNAPLLTPRAAEAIDPRVPVPEILVSEDVSIGLITRLEALVEQATAAGPAFDSAAALAERLAERAGAPQSESWIAAQQALSAAVAARGPVAAAMAEIDELAAERIQQVGGISSADLQAIGNAAAQVAAIDSRQAALIDRLRLRLRG